MGARKELLLARHKAVREKAAKLEKLNKYKYEYRMQMLCDEFHYSLKRVQEILAMDDTNKIYRDPNQLNLFE